MKAFPRLQTLEFKGFTKITATFKAAAILTACLNFVVWNEVKSAINNQVIKQQPLTSILQPGYAIT